MFLLVYTVQYTVQYCMEFFFYNLFSNKCNIYRNKKFNEHCTYNVTSGFFLFVPDINTAREKIKKNFTGLVLCPPGYHMFNATWLQYCRPL